MQLKVNKQELAYIEIIKLFLKLECPSLLVMDTLVTVEEIQLIPPKHMYLVSRNSSVPIVLPSRPKPDFFTPPKGPSQHESRPVFIPTIPTSSFSATRKH